MSILFINGSPNKNGNTAKLAAELLKGHEYETLNLTDYTIGAYGQNLPGDVVNIMPGVKHWHGAAPDSWFSHLAVEVPGENCRSQWCEPVSEEEYQKLK